MNYKDLDIWKKGIQLTDAIYDLTDNFPKSEIYVLVPQMRRCSISIPSNIAEGNIRKYTKDYKRYLNYALGSCAELETQVIIASNRKYIKKDSFTKLSDEIDHEKRMILNLIKRLK